LEACQSSKALKIPQFNNFVCCLANPKTGCQTKWNRDEVATKRQINQAGSPIAQAAALGIPVSTLFIMKKSDAKDQSVIIPCISALKPLDSAPQRDLVSLMVVHKVEKGTLLFVEASRV
jgi:hypothetical protein